MNKKLDNEQGALADLAMRRRTSRQAKVKKSHRPEETAKCNNAPGTEEGAAATVREIVPFILLIGGIGALRQHQYRWRD